MNFQFDNYYHLHPRPRPGHCHYYYHSFGGADDDGEIEM